MPRKHFKSTTLEKSSKSVLHMIEASISFAKQVEIHEELVKKIRLLQDKTILNVTEDIDLQNFRKTKKEGRVQIQKEINSYKKNPRNWIETNAPTGGEQSKKEVQKQTS